jgi:hypothetical protein
MRNALNWEKTICRFSWLDRHRPIYFSSGKSSVEQGNWG